MAKSDASGNGTLTGLSKERFDAVMDAAAEAGLLGEKTGRISGRVNPDLVAQAKKRTGLTTDTELVEYAMANLALEDDFSEAFRDARGTVDPDLKLGY